MGQDGEGDIGAYGPQDEGGLPGKSWSRMSKLRIAPFLAGILPVNQTSNALGVCTP